MFSFMKIIPKGNLHSLRPTLSPVEAISPNAAGIVSTIIALIALIGAHSCPDLRQQMPSTYRQSPCRCTSVLSQSHYT